MPPRTPGTYKGKDYESKQKSNTTATAKENRSEKKESAKKEKSKEREKSKKGLKSGD